MFRKIILLISIVVSVTNICFSGQWESTPDAIVESMKSDVQKTKVNDTLWQWVTDTLSNLKNNSADYLQWMAYIGLWIALLLIIYNWMVLILNLWDESKLWAVKKRLISITVWVVVVTGSYLIIKLVVSLIWNII